MICLIVLCNLWRGPWWELGGGGVRGALIHLTRDGSRVSLRVVTGGQEVAVVEARVLVPAMGSAAQLAD